MVLSHTKKIIILLVIVLGCVTDGIILHARSVSREEQQQEQQARVDAYNQCVQGVDSQYATWHTPSAENWGLFNPTGYAEILQTEQAALNECKSNL